MAENSLTQGPVVPTLIAFSLPVLGTTALQSIDGTVNAFWISRLLGVSAITAIGNANIVMMLLLGTVMGIAMAVSILVAQATGAGSTASVKRIVGTAITFCVALSLIVAAVGYTLSPDILAAMNTPAQAAAEGRDYLRIVFLTMPLMYVFNFAQMAQRGVGDSRWPFYFMLVAVGIDLVLNPLLIAGVGPFPRLGIAGSALSTFVGQAVALVCLVVHLYRSGSPLALRAADLPLLRPDPAIVRMLVTRGLPMGCQMLIMSGSALVMMSQVNHYGAVTAAAYTAASQLWMYVQMPGIALGTAVSSMAAQNVGAGRWERVDQIARAGVAVGFAATVLLAGLLLVFDRQTLGFFLPDGSGALPVATHLNQVVLWSLAFFTVTVVLSGVIRSTGAVWAPLAILALSMWIVRVPFARMLELKFAAEAIWWSFPAGTLASVVMMLAYYRFGGWRTVSTIEKKQCGMVGDTGHQAPTHEPVAAAVSLDRAAPGMPALQLAEGQ